MSKDKREVIDYQVNLSGLHETLQDAAENLRSTSLAAISAANARDTALTAYKNAANAFNAGVDAVRADTVVAVNG